MRVETVRGAMAVDGLGTNDLRLPQVESVEWGAPL